MRGSLEILKFTGMNSCLKDKYGLKDFQTYAFKMIHNNPAYSMISEMFNVNNLGSGWTCILFLVSHSR